MGEKIHLKKIEKNDMFNRINKCVEKHNILIDKICTGNINLHEKNIRSYTLCK